LPNVVTTRLTDRWAGGKALERLELPSELIKCCHNQTNKGPRKFRMAGLKKIERKKGPAQQELA